MKPLIIIVVVLVVLFLVLKLVLRRVVGNVIAGKIRDAMAQAGAGAAAPPVRISLVPCDTSDWEHAAQAQEATDQLLAVGFQDAGQYSVAEVPGLCVRGLCQPEESVWAAVYDHPAAGVWTDCVIRYEDDTALTVGNAPTGGQMVSPPWSTKINDPSADAATLYQKALDAAVDKPRKPVAPEQFAEVFTGAYAREMDWRNLRGGATEEEIRRVAADDGNEYDADVIEGVQDLQRRQAAAGVTVMLTERFTEQHPLSEEEQGHLLVVHDQLDRGMLLEALDDALIDADIDLLFDEDGEGCLDDRLPEDLNEAGSLRATFAQLNETLPEGVRLEKIGELSEPIPADFYLGPAWREE